MGTHVRTRVHTRSDHVKMRVEAGEGRSVLEVAVELLEDARLAALQEPAGVLRAQSDILFASGKADLKLEAQAAITEVALALKEILTDKSLALRVDGHTDTDKIVRSGWKDNLQLSLARARAASMASASKLSLPVSAAFVSASSAAVHVASSR